MKTITNDIQRYLNGEGEFEGKPVLVVNNNFGVTPDKFIPGSVGMSNSASQSERDW
jgi:hypothetical protein